MKLFSLIFLAGAFIGVVCQPARAAVAKRAPDRPKVTVHATACVADTYFTLGEIADIKGGNPDLAKQLAAAPMGRAPLPGVPRPLNTGDIALKLRQAGIDPVAITLAGATSVLITSDGEPAGAGAPGAVSAGGSATAGKTISVHAGDAVNLVYMDGTITISSRAVATQNGAVGDLISLRRSGVNHLLQGTVLDNQNVRLED